MMLKKKIQHRFFFYRLASFLMLGWGLLLSLPLTGQVNMVANPMVTNLDPGQTASVTIEIQAAETAVSVAEVYLNFNPALLQVTQLTPGTALSTILVSPSFDNVNGTIDFGAGTLAPMPPSGTFDFLTITFQALSPTPGTEVTFSLDPPRQSVVGTRDDLNNSVLNPPNPFTFVVSGTEPVYINAGGGAYTTADGRSFLADEAFSGGGTYAPASLSATDISCTADDPLYRSERFGDFEYILPDLPDGNYIVDLFFSEIFHGVAGASPDPLPGLRVFNVYLEGVQVLSNLDLLDPLAGGVSAPLSAIVKSVPVTSSGGLEITFESVVNSAKISAICVRPDDGTAVNYPPEVDPVADIMVEAGQTVNAAFSACNADQDVLSFSLEIRDAADVPVDPAAYVFTDNGDGTASLAWLTSPADLGVYTATITAADLTDEDSQSFLIEVMDQLNNPPTATSPGNQTDYDQTSISLQLLLDDPDDDPLTVTAIGLPPGLSIDNNGLITGTINANPVGREMYQVSVTVDDGTNPPVQISFQWTVLEPVTAVCQSVMFRVNAGGLQTAAGDASDPAWGTDTQADPSPFVTLGGPDDPCAPNQCNNTTSTNDPIDVSHPSLAGTGIVASVLQTERWDPPSLPEMSWDFPVTPGQEIQIKLFFAETFFTSDGARVFDIAVEGVVPPLFDDLDIYAMVGHDRGIMLAYTLVAGDDNLDLDFLHDVVENPMIKAIEICEVQAAAMPPVVEITAPEEGNVLTRGTDIDFAATATDAEDGDIAASLSWSSDVDPGFSGSGGSFTGQLIEPGLHTITAGVVDSDGNPGSDQIQVTVPGPQVSWEDPQEGGILCGTDITVSWTAVDVLYDQAEHFHLYVNPPDINNIDYNTQISTASDIGATSWNLTAADGIQVGANTLVIVVDRSNHVEFTNPEATDIVNFTVYDLQVTSNPSSPQACGEPGSVTFDVSGGSGNETIEVFPAGSAIPEPDWQDLAPGDYDYSVTDGPCEVSGSFTIEAFLGEPEVCDGVDNDCDGLVDDEDDSLTGAPTWYEDKDLDGFGSPDNTIVSCAQPVGFVANADDCDDTDPNVYPGAPEIPNDGIDQNCDGLDQAEDLDGDGFDSSVDCDDTDPNVFPGAPEICDGIDNDCDGLIDDADDSVTGQSIWYADADGDGFGDPSVTLLSCTQPAGYVSVAGDCDDANADINPDAQEICDGLDNDCDGLVDSADDSVIGISVWYLDADGDGFGDPAISIESCGQPLGYVLDATDCDDANADINPDALEICDGLDNDCDGLVDSADDSVIGISVWYLDADGDGFGDPAISIESCGQPLGYVLDATDCDDSDANVYPGAPEICDGLDNDCDGLIDDADDSVTGQGTWYADTDGDGFGDPAVTLLACMQPAGYVSVAGDCDDTNADVNPDASEICDGIDNDCDGLIDDADDSVTGQGTWYADADGDGFGDPAVMLLACMQPAGYVSVAGDCDDTNADVNPDASEICDGLDNDCDGLVDDADDSVTGQNTWYADADGDGFGDPAITLLTCSQPAGYVSVAGDCDDTNADVNPDASEICDGLDNDCNGLTDADDPELTDNVPPVIVCPDNISTGNDAGLCGAAVSYLIPVGTDNCGSASTAQSAGLGSGSFFPVGTTTETYTVTDAVGNSASCSFTVTVADTEAPVVECQNITVTLSSFGEATVEADDILINTASDNCGLVTTTLSKSVFDCSDLGSQTIVLTASDPAGNHASCDAIVTVAQSEGLPDNWASADLGPANPPGAATYDPCTGRFEVSSNGVSIQASQDRGHFAYQEVCGNSQIIIRVASIQPLGGKVGVMMRNDLSAGSPMVAVLTQLNNFIHREVREVPGGNKISSQVPRLLTPRWLRLVRQGNTFTGFTSTNGVNWQLAISTVVNMDPCIYIGIVTQSVNGATQTVGVFDNVSITGNVQTQAFLPEGGNPTIDLEPRKMNLYPNPVSNLLNLEIEGSLDEAFVIEILDLNGRIVYRQNYAPEDRFIQLSLQELQLNPSVYLLRTRFKDEIISKRFVKR